MKNEWNKMYLDIIRNDNSILGTLEKKMENNIINTAIQDLGGAENLLFNVRNESDFNQVKTQINTYYDNFGEKPQDYKLVGYTQEGHPQIMVDLGNDRFELRTVTTDMRN
jgi:flagellar biosynthesis/type III secretory pathway M-ring protein FliF/YscJ